MLFIVVLRGLQKETGNLRYQNERRTRKEPDQGIKAWKAIETEMAFGGENEIRKKQEGANAAKEKADSSRAPGPADGLCLRW
jgi:hypothetical protein